MLIDAAQARAWQLPGAEGCRTITLYPASGARSFVRFIESATVKPSRPLTNTGWTAVELVVQDLDALAAGLADGPFRVIGPPAVLDFEFTDQLRAMQVVGPAGEVLYLTEIGGDIPGFELPVAHSPVDRIFVAVLGTRRLKQAAGFYAVHTVNQPGPPIDARVRVLAAAHGLPFDATFRLQTFALPASTLIEIDDLPATTTQPSPVSRCGLPAGIAIMTFGDGEYCGFSPLVRGSDGELIELSPVPVLVSAEIRH